MTPVPRPNVLRTIRRNGHTIWEISPRDAHRILDSPYEVDGDVRYPRNGLYIVRESENMWTAIDNSDGYAWTEDFLQESYALMWLTNDGEHPTEWYHWSDHRTFFDRMPKIVPEWESRYRYAVEVLRIHQSFW